MVLLPTGLVIALPASQTETIQIMCSSGVSPVKNLKDLTEGEIKEFLDSFDYVLSDCDGKFFFFFFTALAYIIYKV